MSDQTMINRAVDAEELPLGADAMDTLTGAECGGSGTVEDPPGSTGIGWKVEVHWTL